MRADEHVLSTPDLATNKPNMGFLAYLILKSVEAKVSVFRWQVGRCYTFDDRLRAQTISNEICNSDQQYAMTRQNDDAAEAVPLRPCHS